MEGRNLGKRVGLLVAGLFLMAMGVALSVKANLGVSPISCVPYVYCLGLPFTMGQVTIAMHILFILLQVLLLRREFQLGQLLQLPVAFLFGLLTDLALFLVSAQHQLGHYPPQWALCVFSCMVIAFGMALEVKAKVVYLAGEGLCVAVARVLRAEFGQVKVGFDVCLVSIGLVSSWAMFHHPRGIREGTLVSSLLVGSLVRLFNRHLVWLDAFLA